MSTTTPSLRVGATGHAGRSLAASARAYFASEDRRTLQTVLGLSWLLDGGLQFQSFMYSKGFIAMLTGMTPGQPGWLSSSMNWAAHTAGHDMTAFNTLFALTQVAIGLGLLYRPTVKPALALSLVWAADRLVVRRGLRDDVHDMASPLTGAPGAVSLYALIGAMAWPNGRPGGLLGVHGARVAWGALWVLMAWLWLRRQAAAPNAISGAIKAAPSGMSWLSTVQDWATSASRARAADRAGARRAVAGIGLAVAANWHPRPFLSLAVVLSLAYWVFGQGFGGIFQGGATDPNAAPLFVLLAYALWSARPVDQTRWSPLIARRPRSTLKPSEVRA